MTAGTSRRLTALVRLGTKARACEVKPISRGWAILKADSKEEAIRIATEFMELHRKYWPGFEGESEVRPMFEPGVGP